MRRKRFKKESSGSRLFCIDLQPCRRASSKSLLSFFPSSSSSDRGGGGRSSVCRERRSLDPSSLDVAMTEPPSAVQRYDLYRSPRRAAAPDKDFKSRCGATNSIRVFPTPLSITSGSILANNSNNVNVSGDDLLRTR